MNSIQIKLSPIFLDVYDFWDRFDIMEGSFRTRIISVAYKKGDKKDIPNYRLISLLNLDYKMNPRLLKNCMQKTLDAIVGETQVAAITKRISHDG